MTDDQPESPGDPTVHHSPSSSPRGLSASDALVKRDDRVIGSTRLPMKGAAKFIEHFNQTYQAIGLTIEPIEN